MAGINTAMHSADNPQLLVTSSSAGKSNGDRSLQPRLRPIKTNPIAGAGGLHSPDDPQGRDARMYPTPLG